MSPPHVVVARLYEHVEPIDRGERYEDPLSDALAAASLGQVTGGGSQLNDVGAIEFADIEIELANLDGALALVIDTLEQAGAPVRSEILDGERVIREFGATECVAVFLDGVSLPDEVYAGLDFDAVVSGLTAAAGDGSFHGFWQGPEETGLFFFGQDAEAMFSRIAPVLGALPIGQNARVVVRHGRSTAEPRTARMPRQ